MKTNVEKTVAEMENHENIKIPEPVPIPLNLGSNQLNLAETIAINVASNHQPSQNKVEVVLNHLNPLEINSFVNPSTINIHPRVQQTSQSNNATTINMGGETTVLVQPKPSTPISAVIKKSTGLWNWFANTLFLNKFAERAKSSVDSMITTLDPGMREYIYSGGDVRIFVASPNEGKDSTVIQIRDAFQKAFGRATITRENGKINNMAPQSVGFSAALQAAEEKVSNIQSEKNHVDSGFKHRAYVSFQDFVVELVPDRWYDITCFVLRDQRFEGDLQVFSQPSAIPPEYVNRMQDQTPPDYPLRWSGFATTVGEVSVALSGDSDRDNWRENVCGVSTKELIAQAAKSLACMYRRALAEQNQWP